MQSPHAVPSSCFRRVVEIGKIVLASILLSVLWCNYTNIKQTLAPVKSKQFLALNRIISFENISNQNSLSKTVSPSSKKVAFSNSCTWIPDITKKKTNAKVSIDCRLVFKSNGILTTASKMLFLGDSTVYRMFNSDSTSKCRCKSSISSGRCNLIKALGLTRATKWTAPSQNEGPLHFGRKHPFCTDCSGCNMKLCVGPLKTPSCIQQNYIPIEFARDVEMQTKKSATTQEMLTEYLSKSPPSDVCVVSTGVHDMAIPHLSDHSYVENVKWYLKLLQPHCTKILLVGQTGVSGDPKYPQTNKRIQQWDSMISSMIRQFAFVVYISVFEGSKDAKHLDNTHMHPSFYKSLKKMIVGYFGPEQLHKNKSHAKEQNGAFWKNGQFIFPMKGNPYYQKKTATLDTNYDCIRTKKISHMCEYFQQAKRTKQFQLNNFNWKSHWSKKRNSNPYAYNQNYKTCVVLGASTVSTLYDYAAYYEEADAVFVVNGVRPWMNFSSKVNVVETFDKHHYREDMTVKNYERGSTLFKPKNYSQFILTSWANIMGYKPKDKRIRIALPSGEGLIKKTTSVLGLPKIGYTSGIFVVLWLKSFCTTVKVIGFYGFNHYEFGSLMYNPLARKGGTKNTEKAGQLVAMNMLLRLNQLKQIEYIV